MLTLSSRNTYHTLLDAAVLKHTDARAETSFSRVPTGDTNPDAPAIIYVASDAEPIHVSRRDFRARAERYAAALTQLGVQARDLVVVAHTQNLESIEAFWGALLIGAIPSMFPTLTEKLDPDIYMANMAELVRLSNVRAILTTDTFAPQLAERVACPVYGSSQITAAQANGVHYANPAPDSVAFLQHSSGTTGLQKGVALSHKAVLNQLASYADALCLREDDVIVSWLPLYHDMGLIAGFIQPLVQGIPLVLMSPFDWVSHPVLLLKAIQTYRGTLCWLPNFAYNHLAARVRPRDSDGIDLSSLRAVINCSEPVRYDSHQRFVERFAANGVTQNTLSVSYAMAENTFAVTQTPPGTPPTLDIVDRLALSSSLQAVVIEPNHERAVVQVSCGTPITGTSVKVVDERGAALPERCVGEIMVKSDCMLTEYYMRSDLHPFDAEGWYRTGDRGYIAKGEIYIVGRSKDLIIHAGKNVYPQDLEAIVNQIAGIHAGRAVAFGVPDEREGTELIAIVAEVDSDHFGDDEAGARKAISSAIRQQIARQTDVIVNFVTLVDRGWLIKTSSGKIARGANRQKWLDERNG